MLATKSDQIRQPRHGAILPSQLTQYAERFEPGELHQIDRRLGVTTTGQDPAGAGPQRENMARAMQIPRLGAIGNGGADGGDAIGGGNPCGDPLRRLDGDGECGLIVAGVGLHHHGQFELAHPLIGQAEANDAGALADHQRHLFVGHGLRGENEVALVLPIFIVSNQNAATGTQGCQRRFDTSNGITEFTE